MNQDRDGRCDVTKGSLVPEQDLIRLAFEQLMEHVRKQEELVHSWTKYYLSIQAALAVALSFLVQLGSAQVILVKAGSIFIPFLGIVTSICLTRIIWREQFWQGRYIAQIRKLPGIPEIYQADWSPEQPEPECHGYIGQQFWWVRIALVVGWVVWGLVSIYYFFFKAAT